MNKNVLIVLAIVALVVAVIIAGFVGLSPTRQKFVNKVAAELNDSKLAELKSEAEQWVRRIKGDFKKGSKQYETAYSKYIPAKAGVDAWLDRFAIDLMVRDDLSTSKDYQATLGDAAKKAEDFIRYARSLYKKPLSSSSIDVVSLFAEFGSKIGNEYKTATKQAVEEVKKSLQTLKWKSFDDV